MFFKKKRKKKYISDGFCPKCDIENPFHYYRNKIPCSNPKCNINHCEHHTKIVKCKDEKCPIKCMQCPENCGNLQDFQYTCLLHSLVCDQCNTVIVKKINCKKNETVVLNNVYAFNIPKGYKKHICEQCEHLHVNLNNLHHYNLLQSLKIKCWKDCSGISLIQEILFSDDDNDK